MESKVNLCASDTVYRAERSRTRLGLRASYAMLVIWQIRDELYYLKNVQRILTSDFFDLALPPFKIIAMNCQPF